MPLRASRHCPALALLCALAGLWPLHGARAEAPTLSSREIVQFVEHALLAQLGASPVARGAQRVEVSAGALDSRLALGACDEPLRVEADLSRAQPRVNARVSCAGPSPWAIYVPAEIRVYRPVLVTTRELQRGDAIGEGDVTLEERNALDAGAPPLTQPAEAIGLTARRPIAANTVLSASLVEMPLQVRRGDRIVVTARSGGVAVQITAEALGSARQGERVRVRNLQSGQVIDAVVTGSGTADAI